MFLRKHKKKQKRGERVRLVYGLDNSNLLTSCVMPTRERAASFDPLSSTIIMLMAYFGQPTIFNYIITAVTLTGALVFDMPITKAATVTIQRATEVQVTGAQRFTVFEKFKGGASVASGDVNGDGIDEYVVAAGPTGGPHVIILNQDGQTISSFFAYPKKNRDGLNVAVGDLDGDSVAEIITAPQAGSRPEIKVFSMTGKLIRKFLAFESGFLGGVNVAVIPAHSDQPGNIVVSSGFGREAEIRVYNDLGTKVITSWLPLGKSSSNGVSVAAGWSDTFGQSIVVVGAGPGIQPLVQIYGAYSKQKLSQWLAYSEKVKTGVAVGYRGESVVTGPGSGGGPDVRIFNVRGKLVSSSLVFENNFRGGLNVTLATVNGAVTALAVPTTAPLTAGSAGKKIVISLSQQKMSLYEKGRLVSVRKISSGKWSTPTPIGEFGVKNKIPVAYSKAYGLYMENWMAFTADGKYGVHSLPYWKLKKGGKLYEGAAHIGTPASHGCVRQTLADSKSLFEWAPVGTPVSIKN